MSDTLLTPNPIGIPLPLNAPKKKKPKKNRRRKPETKKVSEVYEIPLNMVEDFWETSPANKFREEVPALSDSLLRDYFFRLYTGRITDKDLKVTKIIKITPNLPFPDKVPFSYLEKLGLYSNYDQDVLVSVTYLKKNYEIMFHTERGGMMPDEDNISYYLYMTAMSSDPVSPDEFIEMLRKKSLRNSDFCNKLLLFDGSLAERGPGFISHFSKLKQSELKTRELFLPQHKKEEVERFIYAVENFDKDGMNLRYLLSGPPGTGKTQLMNYISHKLYGKATIIIAKSCEKHINELFSMVSLFEPAILIIDDIDLVIGKRENMFDTAMLGSFLQKLDGFLPDSLFLIATTNDKRLVDAAASRPGRFDLILDIGEISHDNYLRLICRETDDEDIIGLFNDEMLGTLKRKNITGAFLVSLIKQLKSRKKMRGTLTQQDLKAMFDLQHRGFYSSNDEGSRVEFGFAG